MPYLLGIAIRVRASGAGGLAGLGIGLAVVATRPADDFSAWLAVGSFFVGLGLGGALGALLARPRPPATGVRIARARDLRIADYVAPVELIGARILVVVATSTSVLTIVLLATLTDETASMMPLGVITALAIASLVIFEVGARAIVGQASPAEDPTSLAWEDALRADTLRGLVTAPLTFGCVAVALSTVGAFGLLPLSAGSIVLGAVVPIAVLLGTITVGIVAQLSKPQRHFLRVLWPETAVAASGR